MEPILAVLADKMGDSQWRMRASAEEALMAAASHPQIGVQQALHYLTSDMAPPSKAKVKGKKPTEAKGYAPGMSKGIVAKYTFLYRMLSELQFNHE